MSLKTASKLFRDLQSSFSSCRGLAQALRSGAPKGAEELTFVPSSWLERFLRGEDRSLENILEGDASDALVAIVDT